ncbi:ATP-dependent Clp protease proteolytic subunit 3 [Dionaea muscipula]
MEISTMAAFTGFSTPPRPLSFFNYQLKHHCHAHPNGIDAKNPRKMIGGGRPICVNAISSSSLWSSSDLSGIVAPALPTLEELDTTNMLLRQRIIFIGSQIDDTTADFAISQLLLLDAEDPEKDIKLFINSPGGSITAGMGIYDAMKQVKADVSTLCLGLAASMGAFILAAGTKGKRYCMPNSRVMIHQPHGPAGGDPVEIVIRIREMQYHKSKINKIFSRITGKTEQQINKDVDRDNFMSAWEAKEYGLVDAVVDDGKPGLVAPMADSSPPPKTNIWYLWKNSDGRRAKKLLPSEHKFVQQQLSSGGQRTDQHQDKEEGIIEKEEEEKESDTSSSSSV